MKRILTIAAALVLIVGCDQLRYRLTLRPAGPELDRTFSVESPSTQPVDIGQDETSRLVAAYGSKPAVEDAAQVFRARFATTMPDDVGGSGRYLYYRADMGSVGVYMERFRGGDDLLGAIEKRLEAVDSLTSLWAEWLQAEVGGSVEFPKLRAFIVGDLRRDLKNVSLEQMLISDASRLVLTPESQHADLTTQPSVAVDPDAALFFQSFVRQILRALSQDYLRPEDVPVVTLLNDLRREDRQRLREMLATALKRKVGLADEAMVARVCELVCDEPVRCESLNKHLPESPTYRRLTARLPASTQPTSQTSQPSGLHDFMGELWSEATNVDLSVFGGGEPLTVRVVPEGKVVITNGLIEQDSGDIVWDFRLSAKDKVEITGPLCWAVWARPEEAIQKARFGGVALKGRDLFEYVAWRKSLSAADSEAWDALIALMCGDRVSFKRLREFRFADEVAQATIQPATTEPTTQPAPRASGIVEMIFHGLPGSPATRPAE